MIEHLVDASSRRDGEALETWTDPDVVLVVQRPAMRVDEVSEAADGSFLVFGRQGGTSRAGA